MLEHRDSAAASAGRSFSRRRQRMWIGRSVPSPEQGASTSTHSNRDRPAAREQVGCTMRTFVAPLRDRPPQQIHPPVPQIAGDQQSASGHRRRDRRVLRRGRRRCPALAPPALPASSAISCDPRLGDEPTSPPRARRFPSSTISRRARKRAGCTRTSSHEPFVSCSGVNRSRFARDAVRPCC